jgi:hypothetical protein
MTVPEPAFPNPNPVYQIQFLAEAEVVRAEDGAETKTAD